VPFLREIEEGSCGDLWVLIPGVRVSLDVTQFSISCDFKSSSAWLSMASSRHRREGGRYELWRMAWMGTWLAIVNI
jgi:hypothetical protein